MSAVNINDITKSIRDLPSLPAVVLDLLGKLDQEDADSRLLADRIARDQALSAKTLRLANSSFYGMQRKVATIQQAITVLGFDSVRTLVTAAAIIGNFPGIHGGRVDFAGFWRQAIGTGLCAKALARQLQLNEDQAFLAGLLHDIGCLVLITHSPETYEKALAYREAQDCSVLEAERAVLGLDHLAAGRALAEHWKFPSVILKAIELHHNPDRHEISSMSALVQAADAIAHALDLSGDGEAVPLVPSATWRGLHLNEEMLLNVFGTIEKQFEEACQVLAAQ